MENSIIKAVETTYIRFISIPIFFTYKTVLLLGEQHDDLIYIYSEMITKISLVNVYHHM